MKLQWLNDSLGFHPENEWERQALVVLYEGLPESHPEPDEEPHLGAQQNA